MKDLRDWLIEGDPVANEPPLSEADVQRLRRTIAAADESHVSSFSDWARGSWATATVVIAVTIAVGMSRWMESARNVSEAQRVLQAPPLDRAQSAARRQMQWVAPRGTRVIWIFNDEFNP